MYLFLQISQLLAIVVGFLCILFFIDKSAIPKYGVFPIDSFSLVKKKNHAWIPYHNVR